jgi:hypothetical protein
MNCQGKDMQETTYIKPRPLREAAVNEKVLYSAFLALVGVGYLMALGLIYAVDAGRDGKPGLSVQDIADDYYGNRSGTKLEAAIRGPMAPHLDSIGSRNTIVAWLKSGAPKDQFQAKVEPILQRDCVRCHSPASGMGLPDFTNYAGVLKVAKVDTGESIESLVRLSHIHLFGIGLLLLSVGLIFRRAEGPHWLMGSIILIPFLSVFVDIASWFLTKWDPVYAYTLVIAGAVMGVGLAIQIFTSLYQMWLWRRSSEARHA